MSRWRAREESSNGCDSATSGKWFEPCDEASRLMILRWQKLL
jgi:hypothetical protein